MKHLNTLLLMSFLTLVGCANTPSDTMSTINSQPVGKVSVSPVQFDLRQKYKNPVFYSQQELSNQVTECLKQELSKRGKYQSNANVALNVNVDYKRVYAGEAFGMKKSLGPPFIAYNYQVVSNGKVIQQKQEKDLIASGGLVDSLDYFSKTDKKAEDKYLQAICIHIVDQIS